jgi:hypothetical protein
MHLPYINADANIFITHSRAAWTDEGLYTLQLRNWLNGFGFHIEETDAFLRAPLFNAYLLPFYVVLGIHLWTGRLAVILLNTILSFIILKRQRELTFTPLALITLLSGFQFFFHAHLGLAETPAILLILLGVQTYSSQTSEGKSSFTPILLLWVAAGFKLSFVFAPVLLIITQIFMWLFNRKKHDYWTALKKSFTVSVAVILIAFLLWYLPHREFIHYILSIQSEVNLNTGWTSLWLKLKSNYEWYAAHPHFKLYVVVFWLNLFLSAVLIGFRKIHLSKGFDSGVFLFMWLWMLVEIIKMSNNYLPERYLLSALACNILLLGIQINVYTSKLSLSLWLLPVLCSVVLLLRLPTYTEAYHLRTFVLNDINTYLRKTITTHQPVMGNWAASCCWEANVPLKTLARGVHNHEATLAKHHPQLVITEADEADSDKLFEQQGIQLSAVADSSIQVQVAHWPLTLYWLSR